MTAPSVVIVDEQGLSLDELAVACGLETQWIITLVEADILPMTAEDPSAWRFQSTHLSRARRAFRLQRDFDASLTAITVMLDLLEEIAQLRQISAQHARQSVIDLSAD